MRPRGLSRLAGLTYPATGGLEEVSLSTPGLRRSLCGSGLHRSPAGSAAGEVSRKLRRSASSEVVRWIWAKASGAPASGELHEPDDGADQDQWSDAERQAGEKPVAV